MCADTSLNGKYNFGGYINFYRLFLSKAAL